MSVPPQPSSSSVLSSLFNRSNFSTRCKTCLNLAISRIKLLRNKREAQLISMRKEIFQYLRSGQESVARIRVEHIIREQNIWAAYEIIELHCQYVLARVPILEAQRACPVELNEAIATIIFASSRCSDLPELIPIRDLFVTKYGKEFVAAALDLRPNSGVNRTVIEKLTVRAPDGESKLKVLKAIALEYYLEWDSSSTEAEFNKKYEDLLDGSATPAKKVAFAESPTVVTIPETRPSASHQRQDRRNAAPTMRESPAASETNVVNNRERSSFDALVKAQAAIAAANRACAAARKAASLAKRANDTTVTG